MLQEIQKIEYNIQNLMPKLENKATRMIDQIGDKSPHAAKNGMYDDMRLDWWTSGFWPGLLWIMHDLTKQPHYLYQAWDWDMKIEQWWTRSNNFHHDVGFQLLPTAAIKYKLTGNRDSRRRALTAAAYLAGRFNYAGKFIRAWNSPENPQAWNFHNRGWAIIDSMMNLSLLFWASEELGDPRFKQVAVMHADTVMKHFVREDGSVCHIASFDPDSGGFIKHIGGQGLHDNSAWSRGNAWALYGFANVYRYTGDIHYFKTAMKIADHFIQNLEDDFVPVWDFHAAKNEPRDSSAAAIAASGLLELSALAEDIQIKERLRYSALKITESLSDHYAAWEDVSEQGILMEATGHKPLEENVNVSLIYGDYFFVEAIAKLSGWANRIF